MAFPAPPEAPLQERVTFPSDKVELNEQTLGATQAVMLQYILLLIISEE
jgi:hypothetical protein